MVVADVTRKTRGAFFTPPVIADFLVDWALRSSSDRILEPSCGEAAFLLSAARRISDLGGHPSPGQLLGTELHEPSASAAAKLLELSGSPATIEVGNFFERSPVPIAEAVVGNPPYIRYQKFSGIARAKAQEAALAAGVRLPGLASAWAAFVVHAAGFLTEGGRLGLVLPAELLHVNYAAPVRDFLMRRFGSVRLVTFERRVFPDVMAEVVLLLAEGEGGTDSLEMEPLRDLDDLRRAERRRSWLPASTLTKWSPALLADGAFDAYVRAASSESFAELSSWGHTYIGAVTGNNQYFALTAAQTNEFGLEGEVLPLSPPGSKHLRGLTFTRRAHRELAASGSQAYLFYPSTPEPSAAANRYIEHGWKGDVHSAYKCRVRDPWWRVPLPPVPDLFLTYMNHDVPRLVSNRPRLQFLNSVHGVRLEHDRRLGVDLLPIASLNSLTALGAELVGRSYGGGLLKLEPGEAAHLPVPSVSALSDAEEELRALRPQVAGLLSRGRIDEAMRKVDGVLLVKQMEIGRTHLQTVRDAHHALVERRQGRSANSR